MPQRSLFDEDDRPAQAARLAPKLKALAERGVYFGTSSWKYEGWLGSIYTPGRYETHGKFSKKKFEAECLAEYAETFPTVCGDFAFYQFPSEDFWSRLFGETPSSLIVALKVPEDISVAVWPKHARYGTRAGRENANFLNASALTQFFIRRLMPYVDRLGPLILEFGTFPKAVFPTPGDFLERLDPFLESLPEGPRYGVEIRNPDYLGDAYFALLASHNVAHVFNGWTRMPRLREQIALPGAFTADFSVTRALLPKGRTYENAVKDLEPYEAIQQKDEAARDAMADIARGVRKRKKPAFLFVNNRLEGHAPSTIEGVVDMLPFPD